MSTSLYADLPDRLKAAQERVTDTEAAWKIAIKHRNQLIVTAVDVAGMSQGGVARVTGLKQPSVLRICADDDTGPLELEQYQADRGDRDIERAA